MSGMKPSFLTGANAKVKIGATTIAYAQDVSYRVTISTVPIEVMGRYEVISHEPIAYSVEGSLSIIRYTAEATGSGAADAGNGIGKWATTTAQNGSYHFNPALLMEAETFDLEIFQRIQVNKISTLSSGIVKLIDCRFTSKGGSINKRGVLVEQFSFNAILAQDDSFTVANSGGGAIDLQTA